MPEKTDHSELLIPRCSALFTLRNGDARIAIPYIILELCTSRYRIYSLKALGQYISGIRLLNLNRAVTEQVNGNSTT